MVSKSRPWIAGLVGLVLLIAVSCAGGNPVTPPSGTGGAENSPGLTGGTDSPGQSHAAQSTSVWGIYDLVYDEASDRFQITPIRSAQFTFNITGFLQPPDGSLANLSVAITDKTKFMSEGKMTLNVGITHPLNNPRLIGFDTMGVLVGKASVVFNEDPGVAFAGANDLRLLNFDGYTRWMNPVEFTNPGWTGFLEGALGTKNQTWTASVNAYKLYAQGLNAQDDLGAYLDVQANIDNRGAFLPNTTNYREFQIQFPMNSGFPVPQFQYAIVSHFKAAKDQNGDPIPEPVISDFPPEANAAEAIYVIPNTSNSTLYYNVPTGAPGGDFILELTVYDWQGMEAIGGTGTLNEVHSIGLDSPQGLFGGSGMTLAITDTAVTEIQTPGENSTKISVLIQGLLPPTWGKYEVLVAVYSEDPNSYGPNFGSPYPESAKLATYTRTSVDVEEDTTEGNHPPVIDEVQGPTSVDCWTESVEYTCIAHDDDPGDTLLYTWTIVKLPNLPFFNDPPGPDNTYIADWGDPKYGPGSYQVGVRITDGKALAMNMTGVIYSSGGLKALGIDADDEDTHGVLCTNIDAEYTASIDQCNPGNVSYRWLRGPGDPPAEIDPLDPSWTLPSGNSTVQLSWQDTGIGTWWIIFEVSDLSGSKAYSAPYFVERVDTPPTDLNPPSGATQVDCNDTDEVYTLTGGDDCDGGDNERQWTITQTSDPPIGGWVSAPDNEFTVDWSVYPVGTYYAWQRVGVDGNYSVSDPLAVHRNNTPPDEPDSPQGEIMVNCSKTSAEYQAGAVNDCEGDPVQREWALGEEVSPPTTGWTAFSGDSFEVDYSVVPNGAHQLFQRASDNGTNWAYSSGTMVNKVNTAPDKPGTLDGPDPVTCHDSAAVYQAGSATDCDAGDVLTRYWLVSEDPNFPMGTWTQFSGSSFAIDWSEYASGQWFVFQKVSDGVAETVSVSLWVMKENAPPEVGIPSGPTDIDCSSTDVEYQDNDISDCDTFTQLLKAWYLSTSPDSQTGGSWTPYEGSTFEIDFSFLPSDDYYLFIKVSDMIDATISLPLHIIRHNSAPDSPPIPSGPDEVNCQTNPAIYDGGHVEDCDPFDTVTHYHYLSTDPISPTGGNWVADTGTDLIVDFAGVVAEQPYYLFQKVSDGLMETMSQSLEVVYHNTAPLNPSTPSGKTSVSCANDNETYSGGAVSDCDTWQALSRSWAISQVNTPPAEGWTGMTGSTWTIDWSEYEQGTYYMFQRVHDGYVYSTSPSLTVVVGPPTLPKPPAPIGSVDLVCDGEIETYEAGDYMVGCPGLTIVRDWAYSDSPSPPASGWTVFPGTSFDVDPAGLGFGYRYLYQRASLGMQKQISSPLVVYVHPSSLGVPPVPIGPTSADCDSTAESYDMGSVETGCPGTPITRFWQIRRDGTPVIAWQQFTVSPVSIDWSSYSPGYIYELFQKAEDGDHVQVSSALPVEKLNDVPQFLGTITGSTAVTCVDTFTVYECGSVEDCDSSQTLTREWAFNTIDSYPVVGWNSMTGSSFAVDYSSPGIQPGDVYLFQRVSDGVTTEYDPVSLHVVYSNTAPSKPAVVFGVPLINCNNLVQTYVAPPPTDCDGTVLIREWAVGDSSTPPATGWTVFTGNSFSVDWSGYGYGSWYLFQRASDGIATNTSTAFPVNKVNSAPEIESLTCEEGTGPFDSDGLSEGLAGLNLVNTLNFDFTATDCDGEDLDNYWALTTSSSPLPPDDPAWIGPIAGNSFMVALSSFTSMAPAVLRVQLGSSDGTSFTVSVWGGSVNLWKLVWLTDFSSAGQMWSEHSCETGSGTYTWAYDSANKYLRLQNYSAPSRSAVWSYSVALPGAPSVGQTAKLISYLNPSIASGLDTTYFSFLDDVTCLKYNLDAMHGNGCSTNVPGLKQFTISSSAPIWGHSRRIGLYENAVADGCTSSDFWMDWVGVWIQPPH